MSSWAFVLAAGLLAAPPDIPEPPVDPADWPAMQEALQKLAVEWEILDPREIRYVLARPEDFESDLKMLRQRYQDLKDAPKLADCERFPDRNTVSDLLTFNRAYRRFLDARQALEQDRGCQVRIAQKETDALYQVWDSVRDARCDYYYVTVRRQALKRLQGLIGAQAYDHGELPPYVPLWYFHDMN